jgi:hypothetical protein
MYLIINIYFWKIRNPPYLRQSCNPKAKKKKKKKTCLTKLENQSNNQFSIIILVTNDNVSTIVDLINSITHGYEI